MQDFAPFIPELLGAAQGPQTPGRKGHHCLLLFNFLLLLQNLLTSLIKQIDRDIALLLKITQIRVITICVVLDHNTVIFQKEKGVHIKITGMQDSNSQGRQK
jgi:hypothetical protein